MSLENFDPTIEAYLLGKLEAKDLERFENQLASDPELLKAVENKKVVLGLVDAMGDIEIMAQIKAVHQQEMKLKNSPRKLIPWKWVSMAGIAALILGVCIYLFNPSPSHENLFNEHYQAYSLSFTNRNTDNNEQLAQADQLYKTKKYQEALPLFESLFAEQPELPGLSLALGICKMELGQYESALSYFSNLTNKEFDLYKDHGLWYSALSKLKLEDTTAAKMYLQKLINMPESTFHTKAKELYSVL